MRKLWPLLTAAQRKELTRKISELPPSITDWMQAAQPNMVWDDPFNRKLAEALTDIEIGKTRFLMIFAPPQHGKSTFVTKTWAARILEIWPQLRLGVFSYAKDLALEFSTYTRALIEQRGLLGYPRRDTRWSLTNGSKYRCAGIGGGITGFDLDGVIIDDPVKDKAEAMSRAYSDRAFNWYNTAIATRVQAGGFVVLILTRWAEDDLAGRILKSPGGHRWKVLHIPAICDDPLTDPLGRHEGEPLAEHRFSYDDLMEKKEILGPDFPALYQGRPGSLDGNMIRRADLRYYFPSHLPLFQEIVHSWDTASKADEINDYSVCTRWGIRQDGNYLLGVIRERLEFPELVQKIEDTAKLDNPSAILIEDKASGTGAIQMLRRNTRFNIIAIEPVADKVTRMAIEAPAYRAGRIYHPVYENEGQAWVIEYEGEILTFPNVIHKDQTDSTSQFLMFTRTRATGVEAAAEAMQEIIGEPVESSDHGLSIYGGYGADDLNGF